ncbi:autotransporter domain-containing protein [uncultured Aquimarina sp.]|uniref:autotransporter domain-containing protein n=1 Tax=uncultured Aquimarina sp. TaxID=575652 RepID=UPI0026271191|nr:autotransporter domain-containing protein [uncultured Aquimarina sp.]
MKATFLLLITVLTLSKTYAQKDPLFGFKKGDFTISGTMSYSYQNSDSFVDDINGNMYQFETEGHNFSIIPEIGYFVSSSFMAGLKFGYISSKTESFDNDLYDYTSKGRGYSTSLFGRYYFTPQKRVSLFIELEAGYTKNTIDSDRIFQLNDLTASTNEVQNYSITAAPGINIFINEDLSITSRIGRIGYTNSKDNFSNSNRDTGTNKRDSIDASISLNNFYFGVLYRI